MDSVAWQPVLAGQCGELTVLQAAEATLGSGPKNAVRIEPNVADPAPAESVGRCVRCADLTVLEIGEAPFKEAKPETASGGIGGQSRSKVLMSKLAQGILWTTPPE